MKSALFALIITAIYALTAFGFGVLLSLLYGIDLQNAETINLTLMYSAMGTIHLGLMYFVWSTMDLFKKAYEFYKNKA